MSKIGLIIGREYLTRVRKKTFIIMTVLGPLIYAGIFIGIGFMAQTGDKGVSEIAVVEYDRNGQPVPDSLQFFRNVIPDKDNIKFTYLNNVRLPDILKVFKETQYDGVLFLSQNLISGGHNASVDFYYRKPPSTGLESHISKSVESYLFNNKLSTKNISPEDIQSMETNITLNRTDWKNWPNKKQDATDMMRGIGYASGILIYMFIFMFGAQVMQGVFEEKSNRIIEVIISSVKPFQLMMGKVIGIGLIGLTQFAIWIILTFGITTVAQQIIFSQQKSAAVQMAVPKDIMNNSTDNMPAVANLSPAAGGTSNMITNIIGQFKQANIFFVICAFIFYFIGGYLLYGSLFAAIGAAVDSQTDTQQFMFPITIPMVFGLIVAMNSFNNPSGAITIWCSIIPLTSPIVMMARIPFGVPFIQLITSALLLILTFVGSIWMAGKIYRTGILMYGKKASYKELWKWLRYKG
jgi:ABC-2 type transport system permease protein